MGRRRPHRCRARDHFPPRRSLQGADWPAIHGIHGPPGIRVYYPGVRHRHRHGQGDAAGVQPAEPRLRLPRGNRRTDAGHGGVGGYTDRLLDSGAPARQPAPHPHLWRLCQGRGWRSPGTHSRRRLHPNIRRQQKRIAGDRRSGAIGLLSLDRLGHSLRPARRRHRHQRGLRQRRQTPLSGTGLWQSGDPGAGLLRPLAQRTRLHR